MRTVTALILSASLVVSSVAPALAAGNRGMGPVRTPALGAPLTPNAAKALTPAADPSGLPASPLNAAAGPVIPAHPGAKPAAPAAPAVQAPAQQPAAAAAESSEGRVRSAEPAANDEKASLETQSGGGRRRFDGDGPRGSDDGPEGPAVNPALEPPTNDFAPNWVSPDEDEEAGENAKGQTLSFPIWEKEKLLNPDPNFALYKAVKRIAEGRPKRRNPKTGRLENASKAWYESKMVKGAEIDVVSQGESVFGKPVKIKDAQTKRLGELTRDDLKGVVSAYQLKAGVRAVREHIRAGLEKMRQIYSPGDAPVTMDSLVRLIEFPSYLEQYREVHGWKAVPEKPERVERKPLKLKAEGDLAPLGAFLPRVVYVDVDALEGPLTRDVLTDIAKLMRVNTHFVYFSRKPYAAPGGVMEKIVAPMSYYHQVMLESRALAVTDDGNVIYSFDRDGTVKPIDTLEFSDPEMEILRHAAARSSEELGLPLGSGKEVLQPQLVPPKKGFPGAQKFERAPQKPPQVRFQVRFAKELDAELWATRFRALLSSYHVQALVSISRDEKGKILVTAQRGDLVGSDERVRAALGEESNLFLNHPDVVLGGGADLAANGGFDLEKMTGLKGNELLENAIGLILRDHRVDLPGDLRGSASQLSSFMHHKDRFRQEMLVRPDEKGSIFTFAGHVIHGNNDWLVWNLQNGRKPTLEEYKARFDEQWEKGIRQFDPVTLPSTDKMDRAKAEFLIKASSMYKLINKIAARGEILVGTEIPNFFFMRDYARRTNEARNRYLLRTVFDFVALRPDPKRPGHATLVIYDFKTGRTETRETDKKRKYKKSQHLQMILYAYFATKTWVGRPFPAPYLTGADKYVIDDVKAELIFNSVMLPIDIRPGDLEGLPDLVIRTMNRKNKEEQKLLGTAKPAKKKAAPKKKPAAKKKSTKK